MKSINNTDLTGLTVLNTRPVRQARALGQAITAAGGQQIAFPALVVQAIVSQTVIEKLANESGFDIMVFVSANAVSALQRVLSDAQQRESRQRKMVPSTLTKLTEEAIVIAVGEATATALRGYGIRPLLPEDGDYRSETLLRLPILQRVDRRRIVLVKGEGGRNLLEDSLGRAGAIVTVLECYRRLPSKADPRNVIDQLKERSLDLVIVTSTDSAAALLAHFDQDSRRQLLGLPWLVLSERIKQVCRQLGCSNQLLVPAQINQHGIVTCLVDWWHNQALGGQSGCQNH